jgi:ribosomal protein S18 acetylase RimI-like enzyme
MNDSYEPVPLLVEDLEQLRGRWRGMADLGSFERAILARPGRSFWLPQTSEFVIVGPWRHRDEIDCVQMMSAPRNPYSLLRCSLEASKELGAEALVVTEWAETRPSEFYGRIGLKHLESVIAFQLTQLSDRGNLSVNVALRKADLIGMSRDLGLLTEIDSASFPWLWRNSEAEFQQYWLSPGVEIWLAEADSRVVGYIGTTAFPGWGHIDRIAVYPEHQSRGFGTEMIRFVIDRFRRQGARRIALSTQEDNFVSQRLYRRLGFRRAEDHDYRIYGKLFGNKA